MTFVLSREENYRLINNSRSDSPQEEKDVRYGGINRSFYKESDDGLAFTNLRYYFYWYIADREKLTVEQRDSAIRGFMNEMEQTFSAMELDELLAIKEKELASLLKEIAKKYSDDTGGLLTIEVEEDNVSIDRLDEREVHFTLRSSNLLNIKVMPNNARKARRLAYLAGSLSEIRGTEVVSAFAWLIAIFRWILEKRLSQKCCCPETLSEIP